MARPPTYHTDAERPVTVSVRIPRALYAQAQQYVSMRRTTLTEVLLDGLRLRLETPADPRDVLVSQDNTVIQESLVEAAVTPPDDIQYYDNNTVIQEETAPMSDVGGTPAAARPRRGIPKLTPRQVKALRAKRAKGAKIEMLMAQYGISKATVFR